MPSEISANVGKYGGQENRQAGLNPDHRPDLVTDVVVLDMGGN